MEWKRLNCLTSLSFVLWILINSLLTSVKIVTHQFLNKKDHEKKKKYFLQQQYWANEPIIKTYRNKPIEGKITIY